jgi:HAD superfamily hydrolase (TIGR01509 family)
VKPKIVLFDIGGVLVDFVGPECLARLLGNRYSLSKVWEMWPDSPALSKFELGHINREDFAAEFVEEWGLNLSVDEMLTEAALWVRAPFDGALALLDELQTVATLACLTNMNAVYWERIRDDMGFGSRLQHCYASHEIGLLKPDRQSYEYVISDLSCEPAEILFFDDTLKNVKAVEALGIRAWHTQGINQLRECVYRGLND